MCGLESLDHWIEYDMDVVCTSPSPNEDERQPVVGIGRQLGYPVTSLHSGSRFKGYQQSKGNKYHVEVIFQVTECLSVISVIT